MIFLLCALTSSALVSIVMRLSGRYVKNNISMLACNYVMCAALALGYAGFNASAAPSTWGMGAVSGVFFLVSFMLLQWNVKQNGVVLSGLFMKLGVVVPVVVSMIFFGERPGIPQTLGILLSLTGIWLMNGGQEKGQRTNGLMLVLLLVIGGACDVTAKVFEQLGQPEQGSAFLFYTFFSALILCAALAVYKKQKLSFADAGFGLLIGIPNYFSSRFLLLSLAEVPAVAAYPIYCIGAMTLITLAGKLLFREQLTRKQLIAAGVILAALVLLNLS